MVVKATDYSEPLLRINQGSKQIHSLFQKRKNFEAISTIDDMICELILLKNWARHQELR